ncbi:MAG: hypothetical protein V9E83_14055 [Baekduia sp.]
MPPALFKLSPWLVALQVLTILREHWHELTELEQKTVRELLSKSRGNPARLAAHERDELVRIARRMRPLTVGRKVALGSRKLRKR